MQAELRAGLKNLRWKRESEIEESASRELDDSFISHSRTDEMNLKSK